MIGESLRAALKLEGHAVDWVTDAWGVSGEFSGTHQAGVGNTAQFLAAMSWNQSPAAVFDFGAAHGLNTESPRWQVFAGVTVRLGKLF